jgi:membrane-bound lytic murein transglycosylase B
LCSPAPYNDAVRRRSILTAGLLVHLSCASLLAQTADAPAPRPSFEDFLASIRTEALSRGIREDIVDQALADIAEPNAVVLERDRSQAEAVLSLEKYLNRRLTPKVIATGREMLTRHHDLLEQIGTRYSVPPQIVVAIWGSESNYGRFSGVRPTIAALATLAWDPRRSALFRAELFDARDILNRGDIEFERLKGSWAGAMGQVQFMPSSYLKFAEDFDGDGRRDIWATPADIFASIANYLKGHGWVGSETWGREVTVSPQVRRRIDDEVPRREGTCRATRNMTIALPAATWKTLGVRTATGEPLPENAPDSALVAGDTRTFLVNHNYDALIDYNCSHAYAISVALLADSIAGLEPPPQPRKVRKPATARKRPKRR